MEVKLATDYALRMSFLFLCYELYEVPFEKTPDIEGFLSKHLGKPGIFTYSPPNAVQPTPEVKTLTWELPNLSECAKLKKALEESPYWSLLELIDD